MTKQQPFKPGDIVRIIPKPTTEFPPVTGPVHANGNTLFVEDPATPDAPWTICWRLPDGRTSWNPNCTVEKVSA